MRDFPISIRRATPEDASAMTALMSEEAVYGNLLQLPHPSEATWRERLEAKSSNGDVQLVALAKGQLVAMAGLHANPHIRRRHAMHLGMAVTVPAQGKGVGRALMAALIDYADRWVAVMRIELTVFTDNERAIALYRKFGFVQEGIFRAYGLRDGRYQDVLAMARLHPSPPRWD
jgi:putative acetyltransferase